MNAEETVGLDFFLAFGRKLRSEGLKVSPGDLELFAKALLVSEVRGVQNIYWAGRVCLTSAQEHIAIYDRIFQEFFQDAGSKEFPGVAAIQRNSSPLRAALRRAMELDEPEEGRNSGQAAAWNERLGGKRLDAPSFDELALLQAITTAFNHYPPLRVSRRFRADGRSGPPHLRRLVRSSYRTGGEFFKLIRSHRLQRIRRLVLLIDVSRSMAASSRAFVQFAWAAARRKGSTTALCFGTKLTPVTQPLKNNDPGVALERTTSVVRDWDGGTRLSEALSELLGSQSGSQLVRGAVVILLSDGLERGSCDLVAKNLERVSRLAYRLIWVNPLWDSFGFKPEAGGIRAIQPYMDKIYGCRTLAELAELIPHCFADL